MDLVDPQSRYSSAKESKQSQGFARRKSQLRIAFRFFKHLQYVSFATPKIKGIYAECFVNSKAR